MEHCCQDMTGALNDPAVLLVYYPHIRGYYLPRKEGLVADGILVCPWCGVTLPTNLRKEWFDIFFNELKLERLDDRGLLETPGLPDEFKTDEWWKKRGL